MDLTYLISKLSNTNLPHRYQEKLRLDLTRIARYSIPSLNRIVLFGSCARGQMKAGSDLDLLLLTTHPVDRALRGSIASELEEAPNGISTDVIFYTEEQFRSSTCRLVQEIRKDGILLWEKGEHDA